MTTKSENTVKNNKPLKIRHHKTLINKLAFITEQGVLSPRLGDMAIALAHNWDKNKDTFIRQDTLAKRIQVKTERTVRTYLSKLKKLGLISYYQPKPKFENDYHPNFYRFHLDVLSDLYVKAKKTAAKIKRKLREKQKEEAQLQQENIDPPSPDPAITSSLRSEEQKDLYITETASPVSGNFIQNLKDTAKRSELAHHQKLKQAAALKKIRGEKTKRQRLLESLFGKQNQNRRETEQELQRMADERHQQAQASIDEQNELSAALMNWNTTGRGFTQAMHERLMELNKGTLNGMIALIAKKFAAGECN